MTVSYSFPPGLDLSAQVLDLISKIFVADPEKRISISDICNHPWFMKNLPSDLAVRMHGYSMSAVTSISRPNHIHCGCMSANSVHQPACDVRGIIY